MSTRNSPATSGNPNHIFVPRFVAVERRFPQFGTSPILRSQVNTGASVHSEVNSARPETGLRGPWCSPGAFKIHSDLEAPPRKCREFSRVDASRMEQFRSVSPSRNATIPDDFQLKKGPMFSMKGAASDMLLGLSHPSWN